jgi:hypothetical protein
MVLSSKRLATSMSSVVLLTGEQYGHWRLQEPPSSLSGEVWRSPLPDDG